MRILGILHILWLWTETPSGQDHEDSHGITSPSAMGRGGWHPWGWSATQTPCLKFLSPLTRKRSSPALGLTYPSCSGGAVLPTALALLCRVGLPGAGIPAMSAMHCPPLCPQRVSSPSKQEASTPRVWGSRRKAILQGVMLLLSQPLPAPSPAQAVTGGFQGILPIGIPTLGQTASSLLCRVIFKIT